LPVGGHTLVDQAPTVSRQELARLATLVLARLAAERVQIGRSDAGGLVDIVRD
jgi:hypothetical protein